MEKKLSEVQLHVLDIMKRLLDIFDKNNLKYYILGGTMLGAVRHHGFIPWDDDLDLGMPRSDYERFLSICKDELPDYMKLRTYDDESSHHYYYARVVDTRYHMKRKGSIKERDEELWIDIFPLDGMPKNKIVLAFHKSRLLFNRLMYHVSTFDKVNVKRPGRPLFDRMIIKFLLVTKMGSKLNSLKYLNKIDKLLKKYPIDKSDYVFNFMGSTHAFRELFTKEVFGENTKYKFEEWNLVGPKEYDYYLSHLYGDYMKLPPENERNVHADEFVESNR